MTLSKSLKKRYRIRRVFLISGLLFISLFILVVGALIILPQTEIAKTFLLERTRELIGKDIQLKKLDLVVWPSPRLQLFDLEIIDVSEPIRNFKVQVLDVEILLLPLFSRTLAVKRFVLERPEITVRILDKKKGPPVHSRELLKDPPQGPFLTFPGTEPLVLRQGTVILQRESTHQQSKDLRIEDINISITPQSSFSPPTVQASAKTSNPETDDAILEITGKLAHDPSRHMFQSPLRNMPLPLQLVGQAELTNFNIAVIEEFLELGTGLEGLPIETHLNAQLALFPDRGGLTMVYSDLQGRVANIPIRGRVSLSGLFGEKTTFFTWFSTSPIKIQALDWVLSNSLIPSEARKTIERLEVAGDVELINSYIAGSTEDDIPISIMEEVRISHGHFLIHQDALPVTNIEGTVILENGDLRLHNFSGEYRSTKVFEGQGNIQFRKSGPWANIQLNSQVHIEDLLTTWNDFEPNLELPEMLRDLRGSGNVTMKLHGPLRNPENMVFETIQLQAWNFLMSHKLPPIRQVYGTLRLEKDGLTLSNLKAQYGSSGILDATATVEFREKGPWATIKAETVLNLQNIRSLVGQLGLVNDMPKTLKSLEGEGNLSINFKGPLHDIKEIVIERARLEKGRFQIHPDLPFIQGVVGTASFKNDTLRLTGFKADFGDSRIQKMSTIVQFGGTEPEMIMGIDATVMAKDVKGLIEHLDDLPSTLQQVRNLKKVTGGAQLKATITVPLSQSQKLSLVSGEVYFTNIGFLVPQVPEVIEQINGKILISRDTLNFSDVSGRIRDSQARLQGSLIMGETNRFRDLVFQANVKVADIKKIQPGKLPDALEGSIQLKGAVFGKHDSPDFRSSGGSQSFEQSRFPMSFNKPDGMPASIQYSRKFSRPKN